MYLTKWQPEVSHEVKATLPIGKSQGLVEVLISMKVHVDGMQDLRLATAMVASTILERAGEPRLVWPFEGETRVQFKDGSMLIRPSEGLIQVNLARVAHPDSVMTTLEALRDQARKVVESATPVSESVLLHMLAYVVSAMHRTLANMVEKG